MVTFGENLITTREKNKIVYYKACQLVIHYI